MIKFSVMYPHTPGSRFDHDYYRDSHMPMLKRLMGDACKSYTIDKGLGGGAPGAPPVYVAMCHVFCDSVEAFQAAFGPHAKEIRADVANYTDITPMTQISDVVVG
ncbi:MAG: EthD family reductase [Variovorax sp.]|nr:EthD family reductase [Variovorax sp.]